MGISAIFLSFEVARYCTQAHAGVPTGYGNSDQPALGYVMPKIALTDRFCATAKTLAGARGKAMDARGHVERRQDPRITLDGRGAAEMTVAGLVEAYLADP